MSLSIALIGSLVAEALIQGLKIADILAEARKNPEVTDEVWAGVAAEAKAVGKEWDEA